MQHFRAIKQFSVQICKQLCVIDLHENPLLLDTSFAAEKKCIPQERAASAFAGDQKIVFLNQQWLVCIVSSSGSIEINRLSHKKLAKLRLAFQLNKMVFYVNPQRRRNLIDSLAPFRFFPFIMYYAITNITKNILNQVTEIRQSLNEP